MKRIIENIKHLLIHIVWLNPFIVIMTSPAIAQQKEIHIEIEAADSIYFWEPLEVRIVLTNVTLRQQQTNALSQGYMSIRAKGEEDWQAVGYNIPQGILSYEGEFTNFVAANDTIVTYLLVRPLAFYIEGVPKTYYFKPDKAYEIKYTYQGKANQKRHLYQAYSTFATKGTPDDKDFLFLDDIKYPFFLFEPAYGSLRAEQNIKACEEIIAANSPTLTKWAEFYLYMRGFLEFANKTRDNTIPFEQKMELYYAAKDKYFEFQASCTSAYIQEVLKQRFVHVWLD